MAAAGVTLLRAFWSLSTLRLAPQDIPRSTALLALATLANVSLSTAINQIQLPLGSALLVAGLEMLVLFGLSSALLFYLSFGARIVQTLTALMGCGALIGAVVLGLMAVLGPDIPTGLRVLVFLWNLLVMAHILRHALNVHFVLAFFIAVGYAIFLLQVIVFIGTRLGAPLG
ncbi:MAG: hypothetical protein ACU85V_14570 [Gammaproteobacteria bacterium]